MARWSAPAPRCPHRCMGSIVRRTAALAVLMTVRVYCVENPDRGLPIAASQREWSARVYAEDTLKRKEIAEIETSTTLRMANKNDKPAVAKDKTQEGADKKKVIQEKNTLKAGKKKVSADEAAVKKAEAALKKDEFAAAVLKAEDTAAKKTTAHEKNAICLADIHSNSTLRKNCCTSWSHEPACVPFSVSSLFFMLVGCVFFAVGYRFYKPCIFLGGFLFASVVTFVATSSTSESLAYILAVVLGTIFGTITLYLYPLGVFILGVNWGVTLVLLFYGLVFHTIANSYLLWILLVICPLTVGMLASRAHRHKESSSGYTYSKILIFSKTSWVGAYMFIRGVGAAVGG